MRPQLQVAAVDGATVVTVEEKVLDELNAEAIGDELLRIADGLDCPQMRLDLGNVSYLNSTALGKFVSLNGRVRAAGGELTVENVHPHVQEVLEITGLTRLFRTLPKGADTLAQA
jgi:anti-sigma B factor antagonist